MIHLRYFIAPLISISFASQSFALECFPNTLKLSSVPHNCTQVKNPSHLESSIQNPLEGDALRAIGLIQKYAFSCVDACGERETFYLVAGWACESTGNPQNLEVEDNDQVGHKLLACPQELARVKLTDIDPYSTSEEMHKIVRASEEAFAPIYETGKNIVRE
jgi:hypothetical protein